MKNSLSFSKLIFFAVLVFVPHYSIWAKDSIAIPNVSFEIHTERAMEKIADTVVNPDDILRNFTPVGAKIVSKSVNNGELQIQAVKKILMVTTRVYIKGQLEIKEDDSLCPGATKGYLATMDFAGSDELITDNFELLKLTICTTEKTPSLVLSKVSGRIIKGPNYNRLIGLVAKEVINDQVRPLISAVKFVVEKNR